MKEIQCACEPFFNRDGRFTNTSVGYNLIHDGMKTIDKYKGETIVVTVTIRSAHSNLVSAYHYIFANVSESTRNTVTQVQT